MANSLNCLICSSEVISDEDEENSGKRSQFKLGLQLFCKLLKTSVDHVDKIFLTERRGSRGHGQNVVVTGLPCCHECWLAFEQIIQLNQAIKLTQANLMEQFDKLKEALQTSVPSDCEEDPLKIPPDDIFGKIRDQLVSCVRNSSTPIRPSSKRKRPHPTKSSTKPESVFSKRAKEYKPCSVILERLPVNQLNRFHSPENESQAGIKLKQEIISSDENDPCTRKSKQKAFEDNYSDFNDEEYVPSPEAPSPPPSNYGDDPEDEDDEEYPWESEAKPIPEPLPNQPISSFGTGRLTKFSLISPSILLYQYTLIKVSQGYTIFTCQEPECPSPIFSDPSLNWNNLFYQIATHIKKLHSTPPPKNQECPLCPYVLSAGSKFRTHLISPGKKQEDGHRIETVVCEVCWKPIRNISDAYRCHLWKHKNNQEKEQSPEGLPPSFLSQANKKLRKCQKLETEFKKAKVTPKPKMQMKLPSPKLPAKMSAPVKNDNDNSEDEDEYPWESEAKSIPEILPNQTLSTCGPIRQSKFSLISPSILLYQYTLIKVSQGYTIFTCQEPECPSPIFSDSSLNWNSLFSQIAHHINATHKTTFYHFSPKDFTKLQKCPLCPITSPPGSQFRYHLIGVGKRQGGHRIDTVVCEICWKPIRNTADAYRCHLWKHKSDQEKEQSPEELPPSFLSLANKKLRKCGKPAIQLKKVKPKPGMQMKVQPKHFRRYNKPPTKPRGPLKIGEKRGLKVGDHFSRILEDSERGYLLLYKFTLLKASYDGLFEKVYLKCQEVNCHHIINGTDFTAFEEFKTHVKTCHSPATKNSDVIWKCPLCPEQLSTNINFRRHLLFHCPEAYYSNNKTFPLLCTVCWKPVQPSSNTLEYHQWLHKSEAEKESILNNADKQPPPTLVLTKEKEKQSQLKCRHCQQGFGSVANLKAHEATHLPKEQRKRYMCHQCPKLFLAPVGVRAHVEREHQRELMRTRTCPICSKEYNWRDGYKFRSHLRSHTNERPFVCEICGKAFLDQVALKRHRETVHEDKGERPWQCEFCEMSYKKSHHLKRHRRSAHKEEVEGEVMEEKRDDLRLKFTTPEYRADFIGPRIAFPCPACEKVFPLKSRMRKHWDKFCKK